MLYTKTVKIIYNLQGGKAGESETMNPTTGTAFTNYNLSQTIAGTAPKLSSTLPTRDGFDFLGWSLAPEPSVDIEYTAEQAQAQTEITERTEDLNLYAVWDRFVIIDANAIPDNPDKKVLANTTAEINEWLPFYNDGTYNYLISYDYAPFDATHMSASSTKLTSGSSLYRTSWSTTPSTSYQNIETWWRQSKYTGTLHDNAKAAMSLITTEYWEDYKITLGNPEEAQAIGSPTLEMYIEAYNTRYGQQLSYIQGDNGLQPSGIPNTTDRAFFITDTSKCTFTWLASPYYSGTTAVAMIGTSSSHGPGFGQCPVVYSSSNYGLRPVVRLAQGVEIVDKGDHYELAYVVRPSSDAPTLDVELDNITATFQQQDRGSGLNNETKAYGIKESSEGEDAYEWETDPEDTHTFVVDKLETSYDIKTKIQDNSGNEVISKKATISSETFEEPEISLRNVPGVNQVEVTIHFTDAPGVVNQYQIGSQQIVTHSDPTDAVFTVSENTTIKAKSSYKGVVKEKSEEVTVDNIAPPEGHAEGTNQTFNATGTGATGQFQEYDVPNDGEYTIKAYGAAGGDGLQKSGSSVAASKGGKGAYAYGTFSLQSGDKLILAVGQSPTRTGTPSSSSSDETSGGGGGGTFVTKVDSGSSYTLTAKNSEKVKPLLIAAGGNGGGDSMRGANYAKNGADGQYKTSTLESLGTGFTTTFLTKPSGTSKQYGSTTAYGGFVGGTGEDDNPGRAGGNNVDASGSNNGADCYNIGTDKGGETGNNQGAGRVEIERTSFTDNCAYGYVSNGKIYYTLQLVDHESGINLNNSKFIIDKDKNKKGLESSEWNSGQQVTSEKQTGEYTPDTEGVYYIHLLSVDNANNKTEVISKYINFATPPEDGWEFEGWTQSGTLDSDPSNDIIPEEDITPEMQVYSLWSKEITSTFYYNNNGGSPIKSKVYRNASGQQVGSTISVPSDPSASGWTFKGWSTNESYTDLSSIYTRTQLTAPTESKNYYALHEKDVTIRRYQYNGKTDTQNGKAYRDYTNEEHGYKLTLSSLSGSSTPSNCSNLGWRKDSTSASSSYDVSVGSSVTLTSSANYYMLYTKTIYIKYYDNDGSALSTSVSNTSGTAYTNYNLSSSIAGTAPKITTTTPTKSGYNFKGWTKTKNSSTADYSSTSGGTSVSNLTSDLELYAVWESAEQKIIASSPAGVNEWLLFYNDGTYKYLVSYDYVPYNATYMSSSKTKLVSWPGNSGDNIYRVGWSRGPKFELFHRFVLVEEIYFCTIRFSWIYHRRQLQMCGSSTKY